MSNGDRGAIWEVLGVLAFAAVACVPIAGKPQTPTSNWTDLGYAWGTMVYNYQTLIGALTAVGAAVLTVRQMRRSDRDQARRHRLQMYLDRRREMFAAKRFVDRITPRLSDLEANAKSIRSKLDGDVYVYLHEGREPSSSWSDWERIDYFGCLFEISELRGVLDSTPGSELELLTSEPEQKLEHLKPWLARAAKFSISPKMALNMIHDSNYPPTAYCGEAADAVLQAINTARELKPIIEAWYAQLEEHFRVDEH